MRGVLFGLAVAALSAAIGCGGGGGSSPFGPDPDFATLTQHLSTPTGTISAPAVTRSATAIDAVRAPEISAADLATLAPSKTSCDALAHHDMTGTCSCPAGGIFEYDFSALAGAQGPVTLRMHLVHCGVSGVVLDGSEFTEVDAGKAIALDAQIDMTQGGVTASVEVWSAGDAFWARAGVDDGAIVVGASGPTPADPLVQVTVRDRSATWTCDFGRERCTDAGGDVRDLKT